MSRSKVFYAAFALLAIVSVALSLAGVTAGDNDGGGLHHIIRILLA